LELSGNSPFIEKEIAAFLTELYAQAEASNMIRRLSLVYDAMERFEISRQELVSKATVANHLADAQYLFDAHNYPSARRHAAWVLKLDPGNETARKIVGLSYFHLGDHRRALAYLSDLQNPCEEAQKALMLSSAFACQNPHCQLCKSHPDAFEDD